MRNRDITNEKIDKVYKLVIDEFNQSQYAVENGLIASPKKYQIREARELLNRINPGGCLLDIGTGEGIIPALFQKFGYNVISIDYPSAGGTGALKRIMELGVRGYFVQVGVDPIPLEDASVDVVFCGDVIEHLPNSPKNFLNDIWRVIRQNGYFVITTPNAVRLTVRLKILLGYSNWPYIGDYFENPYHHGHHKEYLMAELKEVLKWTGFYVIDGFYIEDRLDHPIAMEKFSDISTRLRPQKRSQESNVIKLARNLLYCFSSINKKLRSSMLVICRK